MSAVDSNASPFAFTRSAAAEIRRSNDISDADGMGLRIAVRVMPDGAFDYVMGFDDAQPGDTTVVAHGVKVLIAPTYLPQLEGATLDFVELEPGQHQFIFLNPNDPTYQPPTEST